MRRPEITQFSTNRQAVFFITLQSVKKIAFISLISGILILWACNNLFAQPSLLNQIEPIVQQGIKSKAFPGCQVLVLKNGKPIYDQCFGTYTYESAQKVDTSTMYDLASLTKTTGTLLAIMKLVDEHKLQITDTLATYLPFLRNTDKGQITIKELLYHESGFPASLSGYNLVLKKNTKTMNIDPIKEDQPRIPDYMYATDWLSKKPSAGYSLQVYDSIYIADRYHDSAMAKVARIKLTGKHYLYSCINFILLKEVAEEISGKPMDKFIDSVFYKPMGLTSISYLPLRNHNVGKIAPTMKKDFLRDGMIQGYVQDPDAALFGGVSGNAGLFANAWDVALVHQMILNGGKLNGKRYLSAGTCKLFTTSTFQSGRRGLGYDKPVPTNPSRNPCCESAPAEVYGHTGYTGTCCWVDPVNKLVYVFLSNRTYPDDGINKLARMNIRTRIQEIIYQSLK
jgi:CubicO group peptidase (beta-lactamase class C family)